jgi:hypothetical protein
MDHRFGDAIRLYQPGDFIALALGRLAAQRMSPERLHAFRETLEMARRRNGDSKYLRMWDEIVREGADAVVRAFTEPSERGQVLRSVVSFRAFVTKSERDAIFREHTRKAPLVR